MKTYIIAECGINHNGSLETAKKMIEKAKECGADCAKFQYFRRGEVEEVWDIVKDYHMEWGYLSVLQEYCEKIGIDFLCSAFGGASAWVLINRLKLKTLKIPSGKITDLDFLGYVSKKFDRFILSTGMANLDEVEKAIEIFKPTPIDILHCVSAYPTDICDINISSVGTRHITGFSDHTTGCTAAIMAVALGARIIEKHFTLDNFMQGPDHTMSMNPIDFKYYVKKIREAELALGDGNIKCEEVEKVNLFRRK